MSEVDDIRADLQKLRESWEFAFAYGHGCSIGEHPQFWITRAEHELLVKKLKQLEKD